MKDQPNSPYEDDLREEATLKVFEMIVEIAATEITQEAGFGNEADPLGPLIKVAFYIKLSKKSEEERQTLIDNYLKKVKEKILSYKN